MHLKSFKKKIRRKLCAEQALIYDSQDRIFRTMLLISSILILCYYGLHNKRTEYNIFHGFMFTRKIVMTISVGYSMWYSVIYAIATCMLVYSFNLEKPKYSLPFIGLFLAEMVSDFCDAIVAIWIFFEYLQFWVAVSHSMGIFLLILGEIWTWFAVLQIYEARNFKLC